MSRLTARLFLIPTGYLLAILAATAVLIAVIIAHGTPGDPVDQAIFTGMLFVFAPALWWVAGPVVTLGFAVAVGLAEAMSIRSWIYFSAAGAAVAGLTWSLAEAATEGPVFTAVEAVASGLAGGLVYWLVAGRSSGLSSRGSGEA
jgi:hypothetical protein